jgi:hypothetical protein
MKRRSLILGGAGAAIAAGGAAVLWKPEDLGGPHNPYFSNLNAMLKRDGPGKPVMLMDMDRVNTNIDLISSSVGPEKTYRVVVKSLPSVPLLEHVMQRAKTAGCLPYEQ